MVGYENAEREPGASALAGIAQTGVNMTWLLTGEGRMSGLPSSTQGVAALDGADERWGKIIALVQSVPFEDRDALIGDFFARARQAAEMERLKQAVLEMQARMGD